MKSPVRIVQGILQWVVGILSKDINLDHLLTGVKVEFHQCSNLGMGTRSLEHTLVHHHNIICHSPLMQAIHLNLHLVDTLLTGTSQMYQQISKARVMITTVSHLLHSNNQPLVVLQPQQITVHITTITHRLLVIINKDKLMDEMVMVDMLKLGMVSHLHMISRVVIPLLKVMVMLPIQLKKGKMHLMEPKVIQLKHQPRLLQRANKGILLVNSLAQLRQVIHLR